MNWSQIISNRTPVKTKDRANCGYVAGEYRDNFLIIEGRFVSNEYMIPKNKVENYDGTQLSLVMRHDEINDDFKI
ncbi:MAG TPA: hypothetical protein VH415_03985 [Nitrososphaeraceae archaeon]